MCYLSKCFIQFLKEQNLVCVFYVPEPAVWGSVLTIEKMYTNIHYH